MKLYLTFYVLFILIFLGDKNNSKRTDKKNKYNLNTGESSFDAISPNYKLDSLLNLNIDLFDTTDCVFKIFCAEKSLNHFESKATRIAQNNSEMPLTTLAKVSKNDTALNSESYLNKLIGIKFTKNYKSGKLRSCGFQIGEKERTGKWKYFSDDEKLDSIVDYGSKQIMTFCKFFEIAHAFGMVGENSKLPERKRLFEIADSLGLKNCKSVKFSNPNWINLDFYPVHQEEEKGHFTCKMSHSLWHSNEWTVEKQFNIQGKSLCFALSIFPETNELCLYESFSVK